MNITARLMLATIRATWRHPRLWPEAVTAASDTRRRGAWWLSTSYLRWRVATSEGSADRPPDADSIRDLLLWRRRMRRLSRMT